MEKGSGTFVSLGHKKIHPKYRDLRSPDIGSSAEATPRRNVRYIGKAYVFIFSPFPFSLKVRYTYCMNKYRRLFVILGVSLFTVVTFVVLGASYLDYVVTASYHPNTIEGLYGLKYFWIFGLAIFLNWLYVMYVAIRGVDETKLRKIGISVVIFLLIIAGAFVARFIPTNYHAEYYIGQDKYSIPWQYNPSGSYSFTDNVHSSNPSLTVSKGILNRKEISIRVSHPGLFAEHSSVGYKSTEKVTLSRSILGEKAEIGASFDDMCNENICVGVSNRSNPAYRYFVDSGFLYKIVFPGNTMPFSYRSELDDYKKSVVDLFDSFKVR